MPPKKITVHYGIEGSYRPQSLWREALRECRPPQIDFIYLVSSPLRQRQLTTEALQTHPHWFEIPVLTFSGLARTLLKPNPAPVHIITETEKQRILGELVRESRPQSNALSVLGLSPYLSQYIAFIKNHNIQDEGLLRLRYAQLSLNPGKSEQALISLFVKYQALLAERSLEDSEGINSRLHDSLLTGDIEVSQALPHLRRIFLEAPQPVPPVIAGILRQVCDDALEVNVSLAGRQAESLESLKARLNFLPSAEVEWIDRGEEALLSDKQLWNPGSAHEEVRRVAEDLLGRRRQNSSLKYSSVAVACSRPDNYFPYLEEEFGSSGIPFRLWPATKPTRSTTLALIRSYLRVLATDFRRKELFHLLFSVQDSLEKELCENLQNLEDLSVTLGLEGSPNEWAIGFPNAIGDNRKTPLPSTCTKEVLQTACSQLVGWIQVLKVDQAEKLTPIEWFQVLTTNVQKFLSGSPEAPLAACRLENLAIDAISEQILQSSTNTGERKVDIDGFASLVDLEISHLRLPIHLSEDSVIVASPQHLLQVRLRILYWLGLSENEFPSLERRRVFFDNVGSSQWAFQSWHDRLESEFQLFDSLSESSDQVIYSYPAKAGEALALPSPLLESLQLEPMAVSEDRDQFSGTQALQAQTQENIFRGSEVLREWESGRLLQHHGIFTSLEAKELLRKTVFPDGIHLSPSQLESYFQCGYRYVLKKILSINPTPEASAGLSPPEIGNFLHSILKEYLSSLGQDPVNEPEDNRERWIHEQKKRMAEIFHRQMRRLEPNFRLYNGFALDQAQKISRGLLEEELMGVLSEFVGQQWDWLRHHTVEALEMTVSEVLFGKLTPEDSALPEVPLWLTGKIDRLDRGNKGLIVIDYKTGQAPLQKVLQGWGFQLPLYGFLTSKATGEMPAEAAFFMVRLPFEVGLRFLPLEKEGISFLELIEYYRRRAVEIAGHLYSGHFPTTMLDTSEAGCGACDLSQACRKNTAIAEKLSSATAFPGLKTEPGWTGSTFSKTEPGSY
jgi:hypothetical protein